MYAAVVYLDHSRDIQNMTNVQFTKFFRHIRIKHSFDKCDS